MVGDASAETSLYFSGKDGMLVKPRPVKGHNHQTYGAYNHIHKEEVELATVF